MRVNDPSVFDPTGKTGLGLRIAAFPATFIIDRQGRVAIALWTSVTTAMLSSLVSRVANESA
jgi:hypothetical protein